MRYVLKPLFMLVMVCFTACYQPVPDAELDMELRKMAEIIADIHVAESALTDFPMGPERDSASATYYLQIFDMHGTDAEKFDQNLKAVLRDPEQSREIYTLALEVLETQEAELLQKKE